ncbi:helix-turn-helix domain-containing protein [Ornithinimicrobium cavernae]|uniref:helix-turn-helix domain-containing protein n=1 Tax=Ornithinimicrobium cavernae TaxID=2666047 RepID=UPI00137B5188|nr:GAF domain-containing protein [Ornithinimicrobium cavernae]
MSDGDDRDGRWLRLLLQDASAEELTAHGASLPGDGERQVLRALRLKTMLAQRAQRARELATLNDIAARLLTLRSPADLLPEIVDQARRLLRVDLAYLGLVREDPGLGRVLRLEVTSGALTPELVGVEVPMDSGLAGAILTQAKPLWSTDYLQDPTFRHSATADSAASAEHMHGLLGAPLTVRGEVVGALFASEREPREFAEEEVTLLCALAAHAGIALDNAATLERLEAAKDELARRSSELEQIVTWDRRLTEVVLRGGGVDDLLAEVTSAVGTAVRFEATGTDPGGRPDSVRGPDHRDGDDGATSTGFARVVAAGSRDLGTLTMPGVAEPPAAARLVLDRAAPVLALAMLAQEAAAEASGQARHVGLLELLTTVPDDPLGRSRQARLAGLDPAASYAVAVVQVPDEDQPTARKRIATLSLPAAASVVSHQGRVVVLAPGLSPEALGELLRADGHLTAGLAGPVEATGDLAAAHREAVETLAVVGALEGPGGVATAGQLGLYRVLLSHTGRAELQETFRRRLGPVEDEETRRGVPLLHTMRVFLDQGRRPGPSASLLRVHVNTLYQRLTTVDRLLGDGWREPARSLELHLLLRLQDGLTALREPS